MSTTTIDRSAIQALYNRAKQLVLTCASLGHSQNLRFAQGNFSALHSALYGDGVNLAARDASIGGYQPATGFEAAWAALPIDAKNFIMAEMQEFLRSHGAEVALDAVPGCQVYAVCQFKDGKVAAVNLDDEHATARIKLNDGACLHEDSLGVENRIVKATAATPTPAASPPQMGQPWPGQGGIYAGIAGDVEGGTPGHLILLDTKPDNKLTWSDAVKWGQSHGEGSRLFTKAEGALLFANVPDAFEKTWHWTGTQYSAGNAWYQNFGHGDQDITSKDNTGRARAVRRLVLESFNPLVSGVV